MNGTIRVLVIGGIAVALVYLLSGSSLISSAVAILLTVVIPVVAWQLRNPARSR
jgi:hypothetical protein